MHAYYICYNGNILAETLVNYVYFVLNGGNDDVYAESRDVVVTLLPDSDSLRAEKCRQYVESDHNCKDCRNRR